MSDTLNNPYSIELEVGMICQAPYGLVQVRQVDVGGDFPVEVQFIKPSDPLVPKGSRTEIGSVHRQKRASLFPFHHIWTEKIPDCGEPLWSNPTKIPMHYHMGVVIHDRTRTWDFYVHCFDYATNDHFWMKWREWDEVAQDIWWDTLDSDEYLPAYQSS